MMEQPRACKTIEEITVGERVEKRYVIGSSDVYKFGELSGDFNPIHFDDDYAAKSLFGRRVAHGLLSLAKFSGIFGMDLPGLGTLWESQSVRFLKPIYLDEEYKAVALVVGKDRRRVQIETWVEDGAGRRVLEGNAVVIPITERARLRQ